MGTPTIISADEFILLLQMLQDMQADEEAVQQHLVAVGVVKFDKEVITNIQGVR